MADSGTAQTRSGDLVGTPCYMAPEQAWGRKREIGPLTDVYALGVILYEMLTGRPPFRGQSVFDTIEQITRDEPVPPTRLQPRLPRDLEVICLKCLQKAPGHRYASAADLADDLERFGGGRPIRARPASWAERAWKAVRRHPAAAAALTMAAVILAALLLWHDQSQRAAVARAERDTRLAVAQKEAGDRLARAAGLAANGEWAAAGDELDAAAARLTELEQEYGAGRLADLRAREHALRGRVSRQLTDRELLRALAQRRADAGSQGVGLAGIDVAARRAATRRTVAAALALFGATLDGGELPALDGADYSDEQRREVREAFYELLLALADAEAEPLPGDGPDARRRRAADALAVLSRADRLGVESALSHWRRARYLRQAGDGDAAATEERLAGQAPLQRAFEWYLRGADLFRDDAPDEAAAHFEKALEVESGHFGARFALAVCHLRRGEARAGAARRADLELARFGLTQCVEQQPERPWPYLLRGYVRGELGEFAPAEADYTRADALLRAAPDETATYGLLVNRGLLARRQGRPAEAADRLREAVRLKPDDYPAYVNLARLCEDAGDDDGAARWADEAVARHPPAAVLARLHRTRARLWERQGDADAARRELEAALRAEPDARSPLAAADRLKLGWLALAERRFGEARRLAESALEVVPDNGDGRRLLAEALQGLGRDDEALAAWESALGPGRRTRKADAIAYEKKARLLARGGDGAGAVEEYTRALELDPDAVPLLLARGTAYLTLDSPALALRDFERVLQSADGHAEALNGRGYARARLGQVGPAVADAEEALRRGPVTPALCYNAARTLAQAALRLELEGRTDREARDARARYQSRALQLLRQALEAMPPARRGPFWRDTVVHDAALNPLRGAAGFRLLSDAHAPPRREAQP